MGTDFIATEHENTSRYIDLLINRFGENEIDSHICDWSPLFWKGVKEIYASLSTTIYMYGVSIKEFIDGTLELSSPILGDVYFISRETKDWSIITLLNRTLEAFQDAYSVLPEWEVLEHFFNCEHKIKFDLELGFPSIEINNGYIRFSNNWRTMEAAPVKKNLGKFHFNYLSFLRKPSQENAENVLSKNYGVLNKCVRNLTADLLMATRFPRLVEVAAHD